MDLAHKYARIIKDEAQRLGFLSCGISKAGFLEDEAPRLDQWLHQGYHGSMAYMENHYDKRLDPRKLVPGAQSVVSLLYNYFPEQTQVEGSFKISKYAYGEDYHFVVRDKLKELMAHINTEIGVVQGRVFVDSAPVLEKAIAQKAGLGWIGKNTILINKRDGSYFFLGEIYTNIDFEIDKKVSEHCGECDKCINVCPTNAIIAPRVLDAKKCIAYLTIELKGSIPEEYRDSIGNRIFGCDDCQIVCPWNRFSTEAKIEEFNHNNMLDSPSLLTLFNWTEKEFKENTINTPINRISYFQWVRNIVIGLGNSEKNIESLNSLIKRRKIVEDPILKEHIDWAIKKQKALS